MRAAAGRRMMPGLGIEYALFAAVAVALLIYLVYTLVVPERF